MTPDFPDCSKCSQNCCKTIGPNMLIGKDEAVPRDNLGEDGRWFKLENDTCVYLCGERCGIYKQRAFMCKAYPFLLVDGCLAVDEWCEQGKELWVSAMRGNQEAKDTLRDIEEWMRENIPPEVVEFWSRRGKI